jgi:hypothetical protein
MRKVGEAIRIAPDHFGFNIARMQFGNQYDSSDVTDSTFVIHKLVHPFSLMQRRVGIDAVSSRLSKRALSFVPRRMTASFNEGCLAVIIPRGQRNARTGAA